MLQIVMEYVAHSQLQGDYLEFGVFEGANFAAAYHLAQLHKLHRMRFYAFDSFQGLPEVTGRDAAGFEHFASGEFRCDIAKFERNLVRSRVNLERVLIVPGWFDQVLNEQTKRHLPLTRAAVVFIDCDLYESVVPVLNFVRDYLDEGTVIVFDDWFCFRADPERGEQRAFREWLEANGGLRSVEFQKLGWQAAFIVRPHAATPKGADLQSKSVQLRVS